MKWIWLPALLLVGVGLGRIEAVAPMPARSAQRAGVSPATDDARRVADRVDQLIGATYVKERVIPAPLSSDSAFLRRVSLDIVGRIPQVSEARTFLREDSPEKRAAAVERLLDSPGYVNHFTSMWLNLLMPEATVDLQKRYMLTGVHTWLRQHFADNTSYDKIVRELVALPMRQNNVMANIGGSTYGNDQSSPMAFYFAKSGKPDELAASVSRLFLGVRLECAQCHDHPFGKWKREEFWSQASFFAGLKGNRQGDNFYGPLTEVSDRRELTIPTTDRVAQARFLDGKMPKWKFKVSARTTLADWITAKDNPFFAKALVNRMWAHFFGTGLVEPVDDLVEDNLASHPEVLDLLAREFVAHDFDLKFLIRAITLSRTYQLSSVNETARNSDPRLYARMQVKGLTGEQLFDSLAMASGIRDGTNFQQRLYNFGSTRGNFLERFTDQEKRTEYHTSIPQALTMMNNQVIIDATHPDRGETLGAVTSSSFMSTPAKIETLFLAALSRKPTPAEAAKFAQYVERDKSKAVQKKALSDVFWALLNSTEFKFNH
jgi:Protein of unknown function (DUF1553)/Protein of unknown function (DUF1549)